MAVLNSILRGQLKGRIGNNWFAHAYDSKGRPVTRTGTINSSPANPKTVTQQEQRAKFANAVKFYQHATQNFFKFAFQDKKKNETDYNAFMRHNLSRSCIMSKGLVNSSLVPAFGDEWLMSKGSLNNLNVTGWDKGNFIIDWGSGLSEEYTVAMLSLDLVSHGMAQLGDIITIVGVTSDFTKAELEGDISNMYPPSWCIWQFVLSYADNTMLSDIQKFGTCGLTLKFLPTPECYCLEGSTSYNCAWAAIIRTQKSASGLKASTSVLQGDDNVKAIVAAINGSESLTNAVVSWGAASSAILQGGVAEGQVLVADDTDYSDVTIDSVAGVTTTPVAITLNTNARTVVVKGTNLPSSQPTSDNVSVAQIQDFEHDSDTEISFSLVKGGSTGQATIKYAGKTIVNVTVSNSDSDASEADA